MIPGILATEVAAALREFIVTGFETETAPFAGEYGSVQLCQGCEKAGQWH